MSNQNNFNLKRATGRLIDASYLATPANWIPQTCRFPIFKERGGVVMTKVTVQQNVELIQQAMCEIIELEIKYAKPGTSVVSKHLHAVVNQISWGLAIDAIAGNKEELSGADKRGLI